MNGSTIIEHAETCPKCQKLNENLSDYCERVGECISTSHHDEYGNWINNNPDYSD